MERRTFLFRMLALGVSGLPPGFSVAAEAVFPANFTELHGMLADAARAPSSHNSQPWSVCLLSPRRMRLSLASKRRLPVVDPFGRESWISLGAFLAALEVSALARGLAVDSVWSGQAKDSLDVSLKPASVDDAWLRSLRGRRTLRRSLSPVRVDERALLQDFPADAARFTPAGSRDATVIVSATVKAAELQTGIDAVWAELADWIRWNEAAQQRNPTGLTPESMELPWLARQWVSATYGHNDVVEQAFRLRTQQMVSSQAGEGAGWIVLSTAGDTRDDWLLAGRHLLSIWLRANRNGLAVHPMSQALEDPAGRKKLGAALNAGAIQMLLRIGKPDKKSLPVSPRLMPRDFVSTEKV